MLVLLLFSPYPRTNARTGTHSVLSSCEPFSLFAPLPDVQWMSLRCHGNESSNKSQVLPELVTRHRTVFFVGHTARVAANFFQHESREDTGQYFTFIPDSRLDCCNHNVLLKDQYRIVTWSVESTMTSVFVQIPQTFNTTRYGVIFPAFLCVHIVLNSACSVRGLAHFTPYIDLFHIFIYLLFCSMSLADEAVFHPEQSLAHFSC